MKKLHAQLLMDHFDKYFGQNDAKIAHTQRTKGWPVDIMVYEPNEQYPFWKLVSIGASDYRMPGFNKVNNLQCNRNEYIMFVDSSEDLNDVKQLNWYRDRMLEIVDYVVDEHTYISYGHSIEWEREPGEEMMAAFIELPKVIDDPNVLFCRQGMLRRVACLQVVLLTQNELDVLLDVGPETFSNFLYPNEGAGHYICERKRSAKF